MSQSHTAAFDDMDILSGALFSWCAERSIRLRSHEGVKAAGAIIDLFLAGYQTQDALRGALSEQDCSEVAFLS